MTGWNMPPGCSPRDIPGWEVEDDKLYDQLDERLRKLKSYSSLDDEQRREILDLVYEIAIEEYDNGYSAGRKDEQENGP